MRTAPRPSLRGGNREAAAALALLAAFCALIYGMTLPAPVLYDDPLAVRDNPVFALPWSLFITGLLSRGYFRFAAERTYQPLITLFHFASHSRPAVYRAAGIALHALNGWLVYRLGRGLRMSGRAALAAALLFCASPSATELVDLSAFKGHLLATAFGLAFLGSWLAYLEDGAARTLAAATGLYALALLSKETGLAFGLLSFLAWACLSGKRTRLIGLGALAAASASYLVFRFRWLSQPPPLPQAFQHSPIATLAWYLRSLLWPWPLCLERSLSAGPWIIAPLAAWALAAWTARARPVRLWLVLWLPAAAAPFLHFISFANHSPVADRYLYMPIAGFCLLLADVLAAGAGIYVLTALWLAWSASAAARNGLYRSERGLYEQTAACAPENPKSYWLLGMSCLKDGDGPRAQYAFEHALTLADDEELRARLGESFVRQGKTSEARDAFGKVRAADSGWRRKFPDDARWLELHP